MCRYHLLYLGDDTVCLGRSGMMSLICALALWQVCHHNGSIQMPVLHARQGYKPLLAGAELHGRVAMRIQGEHTAMYPLCLSKVCGLRHQPVEDGHLASVASQDKAFGMPLHTQDALVPGALHCLYHAIR